MHIAIQNISIRFGNFQALQDVNLNIKSGELVALLGPSGCGKTTLLRIIAGLETADQGQIFLSGEDATSLHVKDRNVGFVFQHYALFRHMSVFDNVAFGLRMKPRAVRPPETTIRNKVHELLSLVQLDWLADRYPAQLSGGQRQRIALARALAVEPKVLLLDEPFGALDAKVRKELRRWLRRLHDELHITSIFVTHDQEEALEVADRVVLMNSGKVEQVGSPQEVWDHPASPFVYGFLGDVNLFHGRAHEGEMRIGDQQGVRLHSPEHCDARDAKAFAFVRPHDFAVSRFAATDGLGDLDGASVTDGLETGTGQQGIVARLTRVIVVGPIARLECTAINAASAGSGDIIEVQMAAQQFYDMAIEDGETLLLTPRKARVFVA